jgi:exosortase D (VPLPA-CTERM-specific)
LEKLKKYGSQIKSLPLIPLTGGAAILIALLWFYIPIFVNLSELLFKEDYSYGLILPIVSGYIVYLKWPQIRQGPWYPSWLGLIIIALGFCFYTIGELSASLYIPSLSFVIVLAGLLFLLGSWRLVRLLAFPLLLLFLTIPTDTWFIKKFSFWLQLASSFIAAWIYNLMNIPVLRQGNVIDLGVRQLQVASACSGLRYILPLLSLGIIYCYFYQRRFWKASILIIGLIPLAIFFNALRITGMGLFPSLQEGFGHNFTGLLIFLFCFGLLYLANYLLNYFFPSRFSQEASTIPTGSQVSSNTYRSSYGRYLAAALILIIAAGSLTWRVAKAPSTVLRNSFDNFSLQIGPWQGYRNHIDTHTLKVLATKDYLDATFSNANNGSVSLWIAYYGNQQRNSSFHSPLYCFTGGGWTTLKSEIIDLGPGQPVNSLLIEQAGKQFLVFYWYLIHGRYLTSEYITKFYIGYDGLLSRRTDGALIRLTTPVINDVESTKERLISFAKLLSPILHQYIPN